MGVEIRVDGLKKTFGRQVIWEDVSFTVPAGQISALLGPSGTGKSVFLKNLIGLLRPDRGHVWVDGVDVPELREKHLYELRRRFGVLFQDGALFGSMSVYDNVAFPLREHTRYGESKIRDIVMSKMEMVGMVGAEGKLPGEISGGMRKRAGLARALVLDPEIILADEPDSGLDPVRTSYLNQLFADINYETGATILIVTHDIGTARVLPDNMGLLFRRGLVMFGHREMILSSTDSAVNQFFNARREGPIGMSEEKDDATLRSEGNGGRSRARPAPIPPQIMPTNGRPRPYQARPGQWLQSHGVQAPPGSFVDDEGRDWLIDWDRLAGRWQEPPPPPPAPHKA
ncbi:ABC transporter ATP-binding protein [Actinocorallia longicatena]|uniref:ABC transporter ATP-binding protein n=1 Tax=Actinocorallia longicatena TaxID=111803 RepID=A0ABP6Q996_9ACTN